jgi:hypothetical protein
VLLVARVLEFRLQGLAVRALVLLVARALVLLAAVGAAGGAEVFIFNVMNLLREIRVN